MKCLAITFLVIATGCCGVPLDATRKTVAANTRDLRLIQDDIVANLAGDARKLWTHRLIAFTVRSQVIEAALKGEQEFDQRGAMKAERDRVASLRAAE